MRSLSWYQEETRVPLGLQGEGLPTEAQVHGGMLRQASLSLKRDDQPTEIKECP
jgi:hypothetical protein